MAIDKQL